MNPKRWKHVVRLFCGTLKKLSCDQPFFNVSSTLSNVFQFRTGARRFCNVVPSGRRALDVLSTCSIAAGGRPSFFQRFEFLRRFHRPLRSGGLKTKATDIRSPMLKQMQSLQVMKKSS